MTIDSGNGSGGTVTRVASGTYDMGFADMAALMEFHANNPDAPNKPVAVMMVYNNTPAAVLALKKSGITKPADLNGKKLGAPVFDAGRKAFPIFQKANNVSNVAWTSMDPPLRETMLVRGDIDAITGFSFTSLLNLEARGVKAEDVVILPLRRLRGEAVRQRDHRQPQDDQGEPGRGESLPDAFAKGAKEVMANPAASIETVKARDGIINVPLETRRLQLADRLGGRQPRRAQGRLRPDQPRPHVADGLAGVRRLRHQEPASTRPRGLERLHAASSAAELNVLPPAKK